MKRLVLASMAATVPSSWRDAEIVRQDQFRTFTPPGSVRRAIEWTQEVAGIEYGNGRLLDLLRFDGTSLWWFIHTLVFVTAKEAVLTIERSERILDEKSPDHVLVLGMSRLGEIIRQVCAGRGIRCALKGSPMRVMSERLIDSLKVVGGSSLISLKEWRRRRLASRSSSGSESQTNVPRLLFLSPSVNWRSVWNYGTDREERRDVFMGRVMEEARRTGYELVCVDADSSLNGRIGAFRQKAAESSYRWVPFERYMTKQVLSKLNAAPDYVRLKRAFRILSKSDTFRGKLQYHLIPLWDFLEGRFRRLLSNLYVLDYARILEAARYMIQLEKPDAIIMSYETGAYARAVIVAAHEACVPTVGIQHGFITPESAEYVHRKVAGVPEWELCPIPTVTAVGGEYTAGLLTGLSSYSADKLAITGYPKYDDLAELKEYESKLNRDKILQSVKLDPGKRSIMLASGGFYEKYGWPQNYDGLVLNSLLNFVAERSDMQLLVRLHPMEDGQIERALIQARGRMPVAVVSGERNELLWASDLFVTVNSITALEALILGKRVFMMDLPGEDIPTVDLHGAVAKFSVESLNRLLSFTLDKEEKSFDDEAARREVDRHANTVDGAASERVVDLIRGMAKT